MCKGTTFISEIGKYFKENNAKSAMDKILNIVETVTLSERALFGETSRCNCKFSRMQVLQLLLIFPCFMVKNAYNYSSSALFRVAECSKDVFYRFISDENMDWRRILWTFSSQLWRKTLANSERKNDTPICLMVDDTDYPKRGFQTEQIGRVFSHVEHKMILGFKALFLGITDGASQMLMDFCLVGEQGKNGDYNLKKKQLDARFSKERSANSPTAKRIAEYDTSKIKLTIEMIKRLIARKIHFDYILADSWFACSEIIKFVTSRHVKCHYLGMIKMGKTKYVYKGEEYTANALVRLLSQSKKNRKYSRRFGCFHITADVVFAGRKVRLFFAKRGKRADWNALITTNTELGFLDAYRIYSMRWSIEVAFKDSKSNLGLGKYQMRNFASQIASTSITAMQYNLLSAARRFLDYETIGGLFKDVKTESAELTVTERIFDMLCEIVLAIAECFELDDEQILDVLVNQSEKFQNFIAIYQQKMAS